MWERINIHHDLLHNNSFFQHLAIINFLEVGGGASRASFIALDSVDEIYSCFYNSYCVHCHTKVHLLCMYLPFFNRLFTYYHYLRNYLMNHIVQVTHSLN